MIRYINGYLHRNPKRSHIPLKKKNHPAATQPHSPKTFYAGGDQFVSTDDGHHYGLVMGDLGAAYGDKWAKRDRHFLFTELTLLHFQNPPYDEWYVPVHPTPPQHTHTYTHTNTNTHTHARAHCAQLTATPRTHRSPHHKTPLAFHHSPHSPHAPRKRKVVQRATADGFHLFTPAQAAAYDGYNGHYCKLYAAIAKGETEAKEAYAGFCDAPVMSTSALAEELRCNHFAPPLPPLPGHVCGAGWRGFGPFATAQHGSS